MAQSPYAGKIISLEDRTNCCLCTSSHWLGAVVGLVKYTPGYVPVPFMIELSLEQASKKLSGGIFLFIFFKHNSAGVEYQLGLKKYFFRLQKREIQTERMTG